jgi:hypothetical protein
MTLQLIPSEFLIYAENFLIFYISAPPSEARPATNRKTEKARKHDDGSGGAQLYDDEKALVLYKSFNILCLAPLRYL